MRIPRVACLVAMICMFASAISASGQDRRQRFDGHKYLVVDAPTEADLQRLLLLVDDVWSHHVAPGPVHVRVSPQQFERLAASGLEFQVLSDNIQPAVDRQYARTEGAGFFDEYHTHAEMLDQLDAYVTARPELVQLVDFGTTVEGRIITGVRLTAPGDATQRAGFLIHGGIHAREWISPATVMFIIDYLVNNYGADPVATRLVDDVEWFIIPVLNVDGYEYTWTDNRLWRKNRRNNGDGTFGVDLNRNWGYEWGGEGSSGSTNSETYRGPAPFSEPETQAMRDFVLAQANVKGYIDFHNFSQLIMWPWAFSAEYCPDQDEFAYVGAEMEARLEAVYATDYESGPVYSTIYPAAGGSADWVYGANLTRRILAFGWELRDQGDDGFLLPPEQIIPTGEETLQSVLFMGDWLRSGIEVASVSPAAVMPGETPVVIIRTYGAATYGADDVSLFYRQAGAGSFAEAPASPLGDGTFEAVLPPQVCNGTLELYALGTDDLGVSRTAPFAGQDDPLTFVVGESIELHDDLETDTGWTVGFSGDDADTGVWERVDPNPTAAQPGADATAEGVYCFVTGQGAPDGGLGENDVDGGRTTLLTPVFSVSDASAEIRYARWYSNDTGASPNADQMDIYVSVDGGATWTTVETVTENANAWVTRSFRLADFSLPASDEVQLRFAASDEGNGSIVEAGIDELVVARAVCPAAGDADDNGLVDLADYSAFPDCLTGPAGQVVAGGCGPFNADLDTDVDLLDAAAFQSAFGQ